MCWSIFAKLCQFTNGEFHSVDIDDQIIEESKMLYEELGVPVNHHMQDSVKFLKETNIIPNLVHLDSWDLDLRNPFPSALHGWREFIAIEDKMPVGSILIVDDNFSRLNSLLELGLLGMMIEVVLLVVKEVRRFILTILLLVKGVIFGIL